MSAYIICGPLYKNEDLSSEYYARTEKYKLINKTIHDFLLTLRNSTQRPVIVNSSFELSTLYLDFSNE